VRDGLRCSAVLYCADPGEHSSDNAEAAAALAEVPQFEHVVAREKPRTPRNALAFWDLQVFAFARLLSARGEKLANPLSR
jgi:hypothetical protein